MIYAASLYSKLVLEHSRAPRNFGRLDGHTHAADGANPLCGDTLRCELRSVGGRIQTLRFSGAACAVATATASMLGGMAEGLSAEQIATLEQRFVHLIEGAVAEDNELGELNAMHALARHPSRRKCALLPFATLRAALSGAAAATTERSPG